MLAGRRRQAYAEALWLTGARALLFLAEWGVLSLTGGTFFVGKTLRVNFAPDALCCVSVFCLFSLPLLPLRMGLLRWCACLTKGVVPPRAEVFFFFRGARRFFKPIALALIFLLLRGTLLLLFLALPAAGFWLSAAFSESILTEGLFFASLGLAFPLAFLFFCACQRWALAEVLLAASAKMSVFSAVGASFRLTRGRTVRLLGLKFRLLLFRAAALFRPLEPWLLPQMMVTLTLCADALSLEKETEPPRARTLYGKRRRQRRTVRAPAVSYAALLERL